MISRRTRARLSVLVESCVFPIYRSRTRRLTDDDGEPIPLVLRWLLAVVGFRVLYSWAYDRDLGAIRTKRWRTVLSAAFCGQLACVALPRSPAPARSFSIGASVGRIGYRLWFGVLHPLPDPDG